MAFSGNITVLSLGKLCVRITGPVVPGSSSGTIRLAGGGGDISLPANFPTASDVAGLTLADLVRVWYVHTTPGGGGESRHVHIDKTNNPFTITVANDQGTDTSPLEIYVEYIHSIVR